MHSANKAKPGVLRFLPDGSVNREGSGIAWALNGSNLTLRWRNPKAPGGVWVDRCILAADGRSYVGTNQANMVIRGFTK